jgi:hypothetical protein
VRSDGSIESYAIGVIFFAPSPRRLMLSYYSFNDFREL